MTSAGREDGRQAGQAVVETALVLPLVALLVLLVLQVGLVARDHLLVLHAAREAARAAAVSAEDPEGAARRAATRAGDLDGSRLRVATTLEDGGRLVRATVRYLSVTDVPLVGALLPDLELDGAVVMRVERR